MYIMCSFIIILPSCSCRITTFLFYVGPKKGQKSHQEASRLSAVGQSGWVWVCLFGQHGLNQSLICLVSADTAISLWKNPIFLMENPCTSSGKTQYYFLRLRKDWHLCRTACRPVALRLALVFFKKVLSLCPYHWLLETLAFRPSVNSLS